MSALRALRHLSSNVYKNALPQRTHVASSSSLRGFSSLSRHVGMSRVMTKPVCSALQTRAFSQTLRACGSGSTDLELSQKLQAELQYEAESTAESPEVPEFLKAFQETGVWQVEDTPGNDEVALTRTFGNEKLRLIFAIMDVQPDQSEYEGEGEESEGEEEAVPSYPIRASLAVSKTDAPGALNIDMVVQEGQFIVDNISFYKDAKLGTELTADADWKRRGLYIGPQFDTLDVNLQEPFDKWLRERGVDETVALFIPDYAEYKEQQEYVRWLQNVKNFVDA